MTQKKESKDWRIGIFYSVTWLHLPSSYITKPSLSFDSLSSLANFIILSYQESMIIQSRGGFVACCDITRRH